MTPETYAEQAAAARIEELEEKILSATMDGYDMAKHEYRDRIKELEAKLVKAQAALREIDDLCPTDRIDEYASQILCYIIMQVGQVSRYAMRELVAEASAAKMCCLNLPDAKCANAPRDLPQNRGHCFIPNRIAGREDWDEDATEALKDFKGEKE
jgi:hypothetical protein